MALPQQGTETCGPSSVRFYEGGCVNGLTPTGDGNVQLHPYNIYVSSVNGLTPTGDGNYFLFEKICFGLINVLMALPQQGTETASTFLS